MSRDGGRATTTTGKLRQSIRISFTLIIPYFRLIFPLSPSFLLFSLWWLLRPAQYFFVLVLIFSSNSDTLFNFIIRVRFFFPDQLTMNSVWNFLSPNLFYFKFVFSPMILDFDLLHVIVALHRIESVSELLSSSSSFFNYILYFLCLYVIYATCFW